MGRQKSRRGANRGGTPPAVVKALREEVERLKLRNAKLEAGCQTPQEKEVRLPTEVWAIIAGKIDKNDVCSFALVSKQLREAQVRADRKLVTRPCWKNEVGGKVGDVSYFTEGWCAYWSRKFNVRYTDPELIKRVLYVAAWYGYVQVFEKYWSHGPQKSSVSCGAGRFVIGLLFAASWRCSSGCGQRAVRGGH